MMPDFSAGLPVGYRRYLVTAALAPSTGGLVAIVNAMDTPGFDQIDEPRVAQQTYYLRYRVSADAGKSWLFDEPSSKPAAIRHSTPLRAFGWLKLGLSRRHRLGSHCHPPGKDCGGPNHAARAGREVVEPERGPNYTEVLVFSGSWDQRSSPDVAGVSSEGRSLRALDARVDRANTGRVSRRAHPHGYAGQQRRASRSTRATAELQMVCRLDGRRAELVHSGALDV